MSGKYREDFFCKWLDNSWDGHTSFDCKKRDSIILDEAARCLTVVGPIAIHTTSHASQVSEPKQKDIKTKENKKQ